MKPNHGEKQIADGAVLRLRIIDVHDGSFRTGNQLVFKGGTLAAFTQLPTS